MENIYEWVARLVDYGFENQLYLEEDIIYTRNKILELLNLDEYKSMEYKKENYNIEEILNKLLEFAIEKGIIEDSITERDNFDSRLMGTLLGRPSEIINMFNKKYYNSPERATDFYYELSKKSNYIRAERIKKDLKWKVPTEYANLDITINMSKPEKDVAEIEKQAKMEKGDYPKCLLCKECEGYAGRFNYPSRSNHRIIPIELNNSKWFFQYSPYSYFNEHSIVLSERHISIKIDRNTFIDLLDFVDKFKHYFIGSNSELPIVGGSILSHNHYQGGKYKFPIEKAEVLEVYKMEEFKSIELRRIKWPLSTIRLVGKDKKEIVNASEKILNIWREYSDEEHEIICKSEEEIHNTITPICRFKNGNYEMDLVLRNNRRSKEHPTGIFHPHKEYHHIKKENIGLIEVMGLAVLPSRLNSNMGLMKEYLLKRKDSDEIEIHKPWLDRIIKRHNMICENEVDNILKYEIGVVFKELLENCGVFKCDEKGVNGFNKFINIICKK